MDWYRTGYTQDVDPLRGGGGQPLGRGSTYIGVPQKSMRFAHEIGIKESVPPLQGKILFTRLIISSSIYLQQGSEHHS